MKIKRLIIHLRRSICLLPAVALAMTSCIDEDLSNCGAEMLLQYNMELKLNLQNELRSELTTAQEQLIADRLEERLSDVFTTRAAGLDLSFFGAATSALARHDVYEINSDRASFTLYMEPDSYEHVALANTAVWGQLHTTGAGNHTTMKVEQAHTDTIDSHTTGLFAGREQIAVESGQSGSFSVELTMQNAASVLVLHHSPSVSPVAIKTYVRDMAVSFCPSDSTFDLTGSPVIRTQQLEAEKLTACYAVSFPSADAAPATKSKRADGTTGNGPALWRMEVYVTMPDGKTAKNTLNIEKPLEAGTIRVLKAYLNNKGELITDDKDVGVAVELNWESGGNHDVSM